MSEKNDRDHHTRVRDAFDSLHQGLGDRLDESARESVERIRAALLSKDAEQMRAHMAGVRERHGWLYRELAEHPEISNLLNELALWGF